MASYLPVLLSIIFLCFGFLSYNIKWVSKFLTPKSGIETKMGTNFPIVGMLPILLKNVYRIHEFATDALRKNGGTLTFVGPLFADMDMLVTSDPVNVHYILNKHFSNFPKGPKFKIMFGIFGDGILNSDGKSWENSRRITMSLFHQPEFQKLMTKIHYDKVKNGLVSVLENFGNSGMEVDLQDIFHRLTFDCTCKILLGHDPGYLSVELPYCALERAICDCEEAVIFRHIIPEYVWKLQRWFKIGKEKKHAKGQEALNLFITQYISIKREALETSTIGTGRNKKKEFDLLSGYLESCDDEKFVRDSIMSLFFAGIHTTSTALAWFFWLLSQNPLTEKKIIEEIITVLKPEKSDNKVVLKISDIKEATLKLVYLHGAICEALRLYATIPINHKYSLEKDVLPSGDIIEAKTSVLLFFYAMGRMESIWGKDCLVFKPERWITEQGGIKHESSSKFTAFNAGPRACLGKNLSMELMKIAAVFVIYNFSIQVLEGHPVLPSNSISLAMKYGLKVRISMRQI